MRLVAMPPDVRRVAGVLLVLLAPRKLRGNEVVNGATRCGCTGADPVAECAEPKRTVVDEFEEHLQFGRCPRPREIVFPKIVDMAPDGAVVYDTRVPLKQPDWTYVDQP